MDRVPQPIPVPYNALLRRRGEPRGERSGEPSGEDDVDVVDAVAERYGVRAVLLQALDIYIETIVMLVGGDAQETQRLRYELLLHMSALAPGLAVALAPHEHVLAWLRAHRSDFGEQEWTRFLDDSVRRGALTQGQAAAYRAAIGAHLPYLPSTALEADQVDEQRRLLGGGADAPAPALAALAAWRETMRVRMGAAGDQPLLNRATEASALRLLSGLPLLDLLALASGLHLGTGIDGIEFTATRPTPPPPAPGAASASPWSAAAVASRAALRGTEGGLSRLPVFEAPILAMAAKRLMASTARAEPPDFGPWAYAGALRVIA
jgi:hypothetical protein